MGKVVAIHQPNFFPWLGYFDKIARSDVFVLFDDVQFPKKGGVWSNRVKLLIGGEAQWVTASIVRNYSGVQNINEMEFRSDIPWREKIIRSIEFNYKKAPFYEETFEVFQPFLMNPENNIAEYNCHAVSEIVARLGLDHTKMVRSSSIDHDGSSNELLIDLIRKVGGDTYMCGGGADGYQDDAIFDEKKIQLLYQSFDHPVYPQFNTEQFVSGLSIIDVLVNLGFEQTKNCFKSHLTGYAPNNSK
jgi:hypothetical protein|tara:strand:+ start:5088 stop:5822 length:735 start_codon:yes stop_codon:yes gene_type:complete